MCTLHPAPSPAPRPTPAPTFSSPLFHSPRVAPKGRSQALQNNHSWHLAPRRTRTTTICGISRRDDPARRPHLEPDLPETTSRRKRSLSSPPEQSFAASRAQKNTTNNHLWHLAPHDPAHESPTSRQTFPKPRVAPKGRSQALHNNHSRHLAPRRTRPTTICGISRPEEHEQQPFAAPRAATTPIRSGYRGRHVGCTARPAHTGPDA